MRTVFAFLLFLLCVTAWGAPVSVPITVTVSPPAPAAFTQQVSQAVSTTVTLNGSQYQATGTLTGTLTFTPVAVNGNLPPGDPILRPTIEQFLAGGRPVETARLGDELVLTGTGFGAGGVLVIGNDIVPTLSWADGEIHALLDPLLVTAAPAGSFVTLRRGEDGERAWRDGPAIRLPLPPGADRDRPPGS